MTATLPSKIPLSPLQRGIWFTDQLPGGAGVYVVALGLVFDGPCHVEELRAAVRDVVARHTVLNVRITRLGDHELVHEPVDRGPLDVPVTDLTSLPAADAKRHCDVLATATATTPFALEDGEVVRARLIRVAPQRSTLVLALHHLVADGRSAELVRSAILRRYAERLGEPPPQPLGGLPETSDAVDDEFLRYLATPYALDHHTEWWRDQLKGAQTRIPFEGTHTRPPEQSLRGVRVDETLDATAAGRLHDLAKRLQVTPFVLASAAMHLFAARQTGVETTVLGFPESGRRTEASRSAVGPWVRMLAQRVNHDSQATLAQFVAAVRRCTMDALRHTELNVTEVAEDIGLRAHALYQMSLNYQGRELETVRVGGAEVGHEWIDTGTARFDLELWVAELPDGSLRVLARGNADILDRTELAAWTRRYLQILRSIGAATPETQVARIDWLPAEQRRAMLDAGTGPTTPEPARDLDAWLDEGLARAHASPLVIDDDGTWTGADLVNHAAAVTERLAAVGISAGHVVALRMTRGRALYAAVLGVLRCGATLLPLDPEEPLGRVTSMVTRAGACALVTSPGLDPLLSPTVVLDEFGADWLGAPSAVAPTTDADPCPAYVLFTSGSTGEPKGVAVSRAALVNRLDWMVRLHGIGPDDIVLHKTPAGFDVSIWELMLPLVTGAAVRVAAPGAHRDPDRLAVLLGEVTITHFVPSMLRAFVDVAGPAALGGPRLVVCSGEALPAALAQAVDRVRGGELWNYYGPTEAAIDVAAHRITRADRVVVPIGRPQPGCHTWVLDGTGQPTPPDVVGELYLGGVQLADGYVGRPDLTAERFVEIALAPERPAATTRLYRSGDRAFWTPDLRLVHVGRCDDQVKVVGARVEPGEVSAALCRVHGVQDAVTRLDPAGSGRLLSWVRTTTGDDLSAADGAELARRCLEHLRRVLPLPMLPRQVVPVSRWPLSSNGKLAVRQLPVPDAVAPLSAAPRSFGGDVPPDTAGALPNDDAMRVVAEAWQAALGRRPRHIDEPFFAAGGDSIRSISLVAAARRRGLTVSVSDVFAHPTPAGIAAAASWTAPGSAEPGDSPLPAFVSLTDQERQWCASRVTDAEDAYPLSSLLSGLVYESRTNAGYLVYTTSLRVHSLWDEAALRDAVSATMRAHPFLRSTVRVDAPGRPLQVVHSEVPDPLVVVDLRSDASPHTAWRAAVATERTRRFAWERAPLLTFTAHRLGEQEWALTLTEPFLDGWSVTTVLSEVLGAYRQHWAGGAVSAVAVRDAGIAASLVSAESAAREDTAAGARLLGVVAATPPSALARQAQDGVGYHRVDVEVGPETSETLRGFAGKQGLPLKSVLLAVHLRAAYRWDSEPAAGRVATVTTALTVNGRPEIAEGVDAVGMFLNNVPMRLALTGADGRPIPIATLAETARREEAALLAARRVPWALALRAGADQRIAATFNFTDFSPLSRFCGLPVHVVERIATDQTFFGITAQYRVDPVDAAVHVALEVQGGLVPHAQRLATVLAEELAAAAGELRAGATPSTGGEAAQAVNGDSAPKPRTVIDFFRDRVERQPDRLAVVDGEARLTYAELARRVRGIARQLSFVRRGDAVGVHLERGADLVATMLACSVVGAAYLPLDPSLPPARVRRHMAAAAAAAVVTTEGELAADDAVVRVVSPKSGAEDAAEPAAERAACGDDCAYVIFTSGSTGTPKGVTVPVSALLNRIEWGWSAMPYSEGEVALASTPIAFVDSIAEILVPLLAGCPVATLPTHESSPRRVAEFLRARAATRLTVVPSVLEEILSDAAAAECLAGLRTIVSSGEPLRGDTLRALRRAAPRAHVWNLYGSSEVAGDVTAHRCLPTDEALARVPAGAPLTGVEIEVCDAEGRPVPAGVEGELIVRGAAVGLGYLGPDGRPARDDRFRTAADGTRVFATGDLGRIGPGGLSVHGRIDRQLKIRGVRVDPLEVEAALRAEPSVRRAAVDVRVVDGRNRLLAWVQTGGDGIHTNATTLALRDRLQAAAVPDLVISVPEWPLTVSGKTDRAALPDPVSGPDRVSDDAEPQGELEQEIACVLAARLGTVRADRHADFFALGGTSLLALIVADELSDAFGVEVSVRTVFTARTVCGIATAVADLLLTEAPP
jgi:amino acid adenylation domain-containing protein